MLEHRGVSELRSGSRTEITPAEFTEASWRSTSAASYRSCSSYQSSDSVSLDLMGEYPTYYTRPATFQAVVKMQKVTRGWLTRRYFKQLLLQNEIEDDIEIYRERKLMRAARAIQRAYRLHLYAKRVAAAKYCTQSRSTDKIPAKLRPQWPSNQHQYYPSQNTTSAAKDPKRSSISSLRSPAAHPKALSNSPIMNSCGSPVNESNFPMWLNNPLESLTHRAVR